MQIVRQEDRPIGDESLSRLVSMTASTNLCALDKCLSAARMEHRPYAERAARMHSLGERMLRALREVGQCLTPEKRVRDGS